jgi:hypothetical protein
MRVFIRIIQNSFRKNGQGKENENEIQERNFTQKYSAYNTYSIAEKLGNRPSYQIVA